MLNVSDSTVAPSVSTRHLSVPAVVQAVATRAAVAMVSPAVATAETVVVAMVETVAVATVATAAVAATTTSKAAVSTPVNHGFLILTVLG